MPPRSHDSASSAPVTTPTTLKSSPPGSESFTSSASTPGSTARSACTGRLGIDFPLDPFYLSTVAAFAADGFVGLAPITGRRTKMSCVLSAA